MTGEAGGPEDKKGNCETEKDLANGEMTLGKFENGCNRVQLTEEFLKNHLQGSVTLVQKRGNDDISCSYSMSGEGQLMLRGP